MFDDPIGGPDMGTLGIEDGLNICGEPCEGLNALLFVPSPEGGPDGGPGV